VKIPSSVKVGPFVYQIKHTAIVDRDNRLLAGSCDHQDFVIRLEADMHPDWEQETCLHEVLHAVDVFMGLDLSEQQIGGLAKGLYMVLKDNGLLG